MSNPILPPIQGGTAGGMATATGIAVAGVPDPPPALMARYHPDQLLKVHVLDHLGRNQLRVQTPQGPMILKTAFTAPPGTQLALKLSQTPAGTVTATIFAGPGAAAGAAPPTPAALNSAVTPTRGTATRAAPAGADSVATPQAAGRAEQSGRTAPIRSVPVAAPVAVGSVVSAVLHPSAVGTGRPAGSPLAVTILSLPGTAPPNGAPGLLTGTVTARTAQGRTLLTTPQGMMTLQTKTPIPAGTFVRITLSASPAQTGPAPAGALQLAALGETARLSQNWQGLTEAVAMLKSVDPATARQLLNTLPTAGPKLTTTLLAVLSLLNGGRPGGIGALIGERALQMLERTGGKAVTEKLEGDFSILKTLAAEPDGDGWRLYALPIHYKEEIGQLRLGVRSGSDTEEDDEDSEAGTRFLLDMALSALGRVQLDGFMKKRKRHFDLILRTQTPLPRRMQTDIILLFNEAKDIGGLKGQLVFQGNPNRFLPMPGLDDKTPGTAGLQV